MRLTCHIPLCALDFDQASEKYQEIYRPAGLRECGSESLSRYHILLTSLERTLRDGQNRLRGIGLLIADDELVAQTPSRPWSATSEARPALSRSVSFRVSPYPARLLM